MASPLWNIDNGQELAQLVEGSEINLRLPVINNSDVDLEVISGNLPPGCVLSNNSIQGTLQEVVNDTVYEFVVRASLDGYFDDRSLKLVVSGPDEPQWVTEEGLLPVGPNDTFFVLDNELIDFQLVVEDDDVFAGEQLEYFIPNDGGVLPPGLQLTIDGRIVGTTEPLLSLDRRTAQGGYDNNPYGSINWDYGLRSTNGYSTFFYDSIGYGFFEETQNLRKLNRYYPFTVSVSDGVTTVDRNFKIYVVGDDFLRADNTMMEADTGVFRADNTHIRSPVWITPRNLGYKRANNYATIFLDVIEDNTLEGTLLYTLKNVNDDGTISRLPPGLELSRVNGEIYGYIPYQPAITQNYKFTVNATRFDLSLDEVVINGTFFEDTFIGATSFKIAKIDLTGDIDGVNDLVELIGRNIFINENFYRVSGVNNDDPEFDVIFLEDSLAPKSSVIVFDTAEIGQDYVYVYRMSQEQRENYLGRTYNFGTNTDLEIQDIIPSITYEISSQSLTGLDPNTFLNAIIDAYERPDNILPENFTPQGFYDSYSVEVKQDTRWWLTVKESTFTKSISKLQEYVNAIVPFDSSPPAIVEVKSLFDKITFDKNLPLRLNQGRNIGLALFRGDSFQERLSITNTDEVVRPSSDKTFEIRVIGEIDSNISWLTDADLGSIKKDLPCLIQLQAETTVPDEPLFYTVTRGNFPEGLVLSHRGNIIGRPALEDTGSNEFEEIAYKFTVQARDRFNLVAIEREFTLTVIEDDKTQYTDITAKPMLPVSQRTEFKNFIRNPEVFIPASIYRPNDPEFGVVDQIEMIVYNGIEKKNIEEFVSAAAKNHKRKKFKLGKPAKAIAQNPGSRETVYEVVYIPVLDPYESATGKTKSSFKIATKNKITVDSQTYASIDDPNRIGQGGDAVPVFARNTVKFVFEQKQDALVIETRNSELVVNSDNNDFDIEIRSGGSVSVELEVLDADTKRIRPKPSNTIKADSDAVKVSQSKDNVRYLTSIEHMRENIKTLGKTDREYLPLWMRTPQAGFEELGYVSAIPLCYCLPGAADEIINNINNSDYNFQSINFDIDRYIVKSSLDKSDETFILFANYQFNV